MDESNLEINVENIMDEIREQIRKEAGMSEIPVFEEIQAGEARGTTMRAENECNWPLLLTSLQYVNQNCDIPYYWSFGPNSPKTFAKRIVRKLVKCILAPILAMLNTFNTNVARCLNQLRYYVEVLLARDESHGCELAELRQSMASQIKELEELRTDYARQEETLRDLLRSMGTAQNEIEDQTVKMRAMARDIIRTKWAFKDYMEELHDSFEDIVKCGICGHEETVSKLEKRVTDCIFDGGRLVRYVCPDCGAVFGPRKLGALSRQEFDDDYIVHYTGYHEGDSTEKEIRTFMRLEPSKEGVYLDYGCGSWSSTLQKLHEQGYKVYGYEPYSRDIENPYIISDRNTLSKMRFNGIFSNDVLEHFTDPIAELRFMKSLLATPDAHMAHSTGCFNYKYEYTRFHMFFFTGKALDIICEKAGLNLLEISDAESPVGENDFHCRTFGMKEKEINYLPMACSNELVQIGKSKIRLEPEGICFGPYITLPTGVYTLNVVVELSENVRCVELVVTASSGKKTINKAELRNGENQIEFSLEYMEKELEFVIKNDTGKDITLTKLALKN